MEKKKYIHEITKTIEGEKWEKAINKVYNKIAPKVKIEGFRTGKAPREKIIAKYGEYNLYLDAVDSVANDTFLEILKESKLIPVVMPKMEIIKVDGKGADIKFTVTTRPDVKLGKYKDLDIKKETVKVTKKEIEEEIKKLQTDYAEIVIKEEALATGDTAVIDYEGFKDGEAFEGGKGENYPLEIGSNTFIPGFEDKLIGMNKGETWDIELTFPNDYHSEELKGKDVVFKVKLNEIRSKELPKLDEDFFKDLGFEDVKTKEELENKIEENIKLYKEGEIENKYIDEVLKKVIETSEMDVIEEEVNMEVDRMLKQFEQQVGMQGVTLDQYCEFAKTSVDKLKENLINPATDRVKSRMVLEKIAEEEKLTANEKEIDEEVTRLAKLYQMTEEELIKSFQGKDMIGYDLKMQKALNILKG